MDKNSILIASDHNGNAARAYIVKFLESLGGYRVLDMGPSEKEGKVDYIDYASNMCKLIDDSGYYRGILICGTGTGMCIVANRFPQVRAALVTDRATSALSREHNNSNVLVLGQWRTPLGAMDEIVKTWLETPFGEGRHVARLEKLKALKIHG